MDENASILALLCFLPPWRIDLLYEFLAGTVATTVVVERDRVDAFAIA